MIINRQNRTSDHIYVITHTHTHTYIHICAHHKNQ